MNKRNSFLCNREGATLPLVALMFILLLIVTGVVVDAGRLYAIQGKAQSASDAALLGAMATRSTTEPVAEYTKLFNANYPIDYMGGKITNVKVTETTPGSGVYQATFTVTLPTAIMGFFGTQFTKANILSQVLQNPKRSFEISLVLDNSGSMANSAGGVKIDGLKQASKDLLDIMFSSGDTRDNVTVSVVPFDIVVQIGANHSDWIQTPSLPKYNNFTSGNGTTDGTSKGFAFNRFTDVLCGPTPAANANCTPCTPGQTSTFNGTDPETGQPITFTLQCPNTGKFCDSLSTACQPNGLKDADDTPPTTQQTKFRLPLELAVDGFDADKTGYWGEDSKYVGKLAPLLFGSNTKSEIAAALNVMEPSGDTRLNVGLMWGWFTLSPKWSGLWGKAGLPAPAGPNLDKIIIFMTDGKNVFPDDDAKTREMCDAIKAENITIYSIGFGGEDINTDLLKYCATQPTYYYLAPTSAELRTVFKEIGDNILYPTLRLSQ